MKKLENALVVKSNRLIEASYRLDLAEQRMILMAIDNARQTGLGITADNFLTIRADEYALMFNVDMNTAYDQLKSAAKTLFHRYVVLHDIHPESGKERVLDARWVSSVAYVEGSGLIQLQFGGVIVPYITRLEENFTSYKLKSVAQMTSAYAIRLYELLMQWEKIGKREVELQGLKNMLGVGGEYSALKDFKKYVLDLAVTQVNEFSDLEVRYENIKFGRRVVGFGFFFGEKQNPKSEKPQNTSSKKSKPPKMVMASFAGLELITFSQLKKTYPDLTERDIREMAAKKPEEPLSLMLRMQKELGNTANFKLEKSS